MEHGVKTNGTDSKGSVEVAQNKSKSVKKNYIFNLAYQLLALLIPLITTPYISRVLGAEGVGTYSFTTATVSYFILIANMGSNYYASREIAYYRDDVNERSKIFWEVIFYRLITTIISLIAYFIIIFHSKYFAIYLVQSILIISVPFDVSWFFAGMEEFGVTVLRNIIVKLSGLGYIFIFVRTKNDLVIYVLGITGATFLGNISFWINVPKYICRVPISELKPFRNWKVILQLFIPYIATQIYTALDKTMIGYFTNSSVYNGYYEQSEKIVKIALTVITTLGMVMVPRYAYLYKQKAWDEINVFLKKSFSFVWLIGIPMSLGIIAVSNSFVPWFFGEGYDPVASLMKIFSVLIISIGLSSLLGSQYLIPTGRQNYYTITVVAGAIINVILNLILIPGFMAYGAAIASITAESTIAVMQMFILRKEISLKLIFGTAKNYLIAGIIMFAVSFGVSKYVNNTIIGTIIIVLCGGLTYVFGLVVLKDDFLLFYLRNLKAKFKY